MPIKAVPEASQAGGEVLLLSFWASCRFSDDALQIAYELTDELAGTRKNQESGESYAGTGPRGTAWDHRGTLVTDAEDMMETTPLAIHRTPTWASKTGLELTCPPGVVHVRTMQSDIR